jgi:hypothetical protein
MKQLTEDQRRNIREILDDKSCTYCKYLYSTYVSWWCGNKDAIDARGTRIPGVIHCPYFKINKKYARKKLKIKKLNKTLQKLWKV